MRDQFVNLSKQMFILLTFCVSKFCAFGRSFSFVFHRKSKDDAVKLLGLRIMKIQFNNEVFAKSIVNFRAID